MINYMSDKLLWSGFVMIIDSDWFDKVMKKLSKYEQHIVLSHDINFHNDFNGSPIIILKGCNYTANGNNTLDSLEISETEIMHFDEDDVREKRERAFIKFEEELFKDSSKVICETFDN